MHQGEVNALSAWITFGADTAYQAAVSAVGLPDRGLAALVLIESHPSHSVDWLYRRLGITQSGTVRLLDRLESAGLIRRDRRPGKRQVAVTITADGRGLLARGIAARARALEDLIAPLSPAEQDELTRLIDKTLTHQARSRDRADIACRLCDWNACADACPVDASVTRSGEEGG